MSTSAVSVSVPVAVKVSVAVIVAVAAGSVSVIVSFADTVGVADGSVSVIVPVMAGSPAPSMLPAPGNAPVAARSSWLQNSRNSALRSSSRVLGEA